MRARNLTVLDSGYMRHGLFIKVSEGRLSRPKIWAIQRCLNTEQVLSIQADGDQPQSVSHEDNNGRTRSHEHVRHTGGLRFQP